MNPDRRHLQIRKLKLGDPEPDNDPAIDAMTPGERIELCFEVTRRCVAMQGIDWDGQRLQRHIVRVQKNGR